MNMAITVWNQRIAPVFDSARNVIIVEVREGRETGRRSLELDQMDPGGKAWLLRNEGVTELVCGAISREAEAMVRDQGIHVIPFIAGEVELVIQAWIGRQLDHDTYSMPGCGHRRRRRGQGRAWRTQGG
ncbi:MAG: NifB/NifX family molybdenum-iron cluster-binding protein [Clostridia bacterium]|jgi:predicted Fe-Mo cluster-binding NifX family protein|nr:NifB/NifX family molybdenum-iron cluster-binding protein [Spirochaetia bacterium]